jgi:TRAP transporter TAXI family solute receptor
MVTDKVVILPIDDAGYQSLKKINPFVSKRVLPAGTYPNQFYEVETCGDPADLIITRIDVPEDLVYQMTKYLYENADDVRAVAAAVRQFGPDLVAPSEEMLIPYHPGALRYFKEAGILK